jgi:hypothetical protein
MPFTFCHPAIILPLTKSKKLSTSALILGSTAPDFEYFIRMDMVRSHSHDFWAIFYFNLPLTIGLYLIFQFIVKTPLINNSTSFFYTRFNRFLNLKPDLFTFKNIIYITISACIGIFSHLLWDSFTHKEGFFEGHLPFLLDSFHFLNKDVLVFQFLQTWSSIIGGLYILFFIYKMPTQTVKHESNVLQFWSIALLVSLAVILLRNCQNSHQFIATSISSGLIGLILSSYYFKKKFKNELKY